MAGHPKIRGKIGLIAIAVSVSAESREDLLGAFLREKPAAKS